MSVQVREPYKRHYVFLMVLCTLFGAAGYAQTSATSSSSDDDSAFGNMFGDDSSGGDWGSAVPAADKAQDKAANAAPSANAGPWGTGSGSSSSSTDDSNWGDSTSSSTTSSTRAAHATHAHARTKSHSAATHASRSARYSRTHPGAHPSTTTTHAHPQSHSAATHASRFARYSQTHPGAHPSTTTTHAHQSWRSRHQHAQSGTQGTTSGGVTQSQSGTTAPAHQGFFARHFHHNTTPSTTAGATGSGSDPSQAGTSAAPHQSWFARHFHHNTTSSTTASGTADDSSDPSQSGSSTSSSGLSVRQRMSNFFHNHSPFGHNNQNGGGGGQQGGQGGQSNAGGGQQGGGGYGGGSAPGGSNGGSTACGSQQGGGGYGGGSAPGGSNGSTAGGSQQGGGYGSGSAPGGSNASTGSGGSNTAAGTGGSTNTSQQSAPSTTSQQNPSSTPSTGVPSTGTASGAQTPATSSVATPTSTTSAAPVSTTAVAPSTPAPAPAPSAPSTVAPAGNQGAPGTTMPGVPESYNPYGIHYKTVFAGVEDPEFQSKLLSASALFEEEGFPPMTFAALQDRIQKDLPNLQKVLQAEGYYEGTITPAVNSRVVPVEITLQVTPGVPYTIGLFDLQYGGDDKKVKEAILNTSLWGFKLGDIALAERVDQAKQKVLDEVGDVGYPFVNFVDEKVLLDQNKRQVLIHLSVEPGQQAKFGDVTLVGLTHTNKAFVMNRLQWKKGDLFDTDKVKDSVRLLEETGDFDSVEITHPKTVDQTGMLPITVVLKEGSQDELRVGTQYVPGLNVGGMASWTHRNAFGKGETLEMKLAGYSKQQSLDVSLTMPDVLKLQQPVKLHGQWVNEQLKPYSKHGVSVEGRLETNLSSQASAFIGAGFETETVKRLGIKNDYSVISIPKGIRMNTTDSVLEPTKGYEGLLGLTSSVGTNSTTNSFFKARSENSVYIPLIPKSDFLLLALKMNLGLMPGASRNKTPPDKFFFLGGPNTIRGYSYQMVGPLSGNTPLGGRSMINSSAEFRTRLNSTLGFVAFLDAGNVYDTQAPDFSGKMFMGVGGGLRLYTPLGPLRVDLATPLNRRSGIDSAIQVYFGLGQQF